MAEDATNAKSVIAVATAMFSNYYDPDDPNCQSAYLALVDDLYEIMDPSGQTKEYEDDLDETSRKTRSSLYKENADGTPKDTNIDGDAIYYKESKTLHTNEYREDSDSTYSDDYDDTYTIYCNDSTTYAEPERILAEGGALYKSGKITDPDDLPERTDKGCRYDSAGYASARNDWQDDRPDPPDIDDYDYTGGFQDYDEAGRIHDQVLG